MGMVTVEKTIQVYPNQKPWMTSQVRSLLWARDAAFSSGDRALYSTARANLRRGIKDARGRQKGNSTTDVAERTVHQLQGLFCDTWGLGQRN